MPADDFPTGDAYAPSYGAAADVDRAKKEAPFGEGFTQRGSTGLNAKRQVWNMRYNVSTSTEATTLHNFFDTYGSITSFLWTTPKGEQIRVTRVSEKWTYPKFDRTVFSVTFRQEFDL